MNDNNSAHVQTLWECRHHCQKTLFEYCLTMGGLHTQPEHIRRMLDCIEICQLAADFMTRGSVSAQYEIMEACAEICLLCATSCEKISDEKMLQCAEICRKCEKACRKMTSKAAA